MRNYREHIEVMLRDRTAALVAFEERLDRETRDRIKAEQALQKARNEDVIASK